MGLPNANVASDYRVENHGSVCLVYPDSQAAKDWLEENVGEAQWLGGGMAVEPRFLANLVDGMRDAGLVQL